MQMKSYALFLIASLLCYISGIMLISYNNTPLGCTGIGLGCSFFAIALRRRKTVKKDQGK